MTIPAIPLPNGFPKQPRANRAFDRTRWKPGILVPGRIEGGEYDLWQSFANAYPDAAASAKWLTTLTLMNMTQEKK